MKLKFTNLLFRKQNYIIEVTLSYNIMFHMYNIVFPLLCTYILPHTHYQKFVFHQMTPPPLPFLPTPLPSPLITITLFSVCTYLWVWFVHYFLFVCLIVFKYKSEIMWYMSFSIWLILLSIKWSSSIHVVANGKVTSFLFF